MAPVPLVRYKKKDVMYQIEKRLSTHERYNQPMGSAGLHPDTSSVRWDLTLLDDTDAAIAREQTDKAFDEDRKALIAGGDSRMVSLARQYLRKKGGYRILGVSRLTYNYSLII